MVKAELDIENISEESKGIIDLIKEGKHFLLSGGAGSGKTYSMVEIINTILEIYPTLNIGCITYTNAAVDEIEARVESDNLYVSTIHDFLWANIKHFQLEIKETLIELINDPFQLKIKHPDGEIVDNNFFDNCKIQYKEYLKITEGIISHDEVIVLAAKMFDKYEKLCAITKDKYPFIFVDEYQDTDPLIVETLLDYLEKSTKKNVIGFFGDAMQSIYPGSVGNLDKYTKIAKPKVIEIFKKQNRRNPQKIITLANALRNDGLIQEVSNDLSAPNMNEDGEIKQGNIQFLYSITNKIDLVRNYLKWDFTNSKQVKELNLTHSLISEQADFPELMRIYDKDKIGDYIRTKIRKLLEEQESNFDTKGKTLADIIEYLNTPKPTSGQQDYIKNYPEVYELAKSLPYDQISRLYVDKDHLLDDKKNYVDDESKPGSDRDDLIKHLFKIENCIRLYEAKLYNQFIQSTDFKLVSIEDKIRLQDAIKSFEITPNIKIGEVIDKAHELGLVIKDDKLSRFYTQKFYIYKQVCDVKYQEFQNVYEYLEGYSPFSTQHKTKGAEFPNVLVVLDNAKWTQYNFKYLFEQKGNENVKLRSEKIFYVCCTRAKENLAVFFPNPTNEAILTAKSWFGEENIINLDEL